MRSLAWLFLSLVVLAGCRKPEFLELEPTGYTFKRVGEDVWWKATAKSRDGRIFHKKTDVTWSSSDHTVATVDEKGRVKAVGAGSATIKAELEGLKAEAIVEVVLVDRVQITPASLTLTSMGEPQKIDIKLFDNIGRELKERLPLARCADEKVCRVSDDGVHGVDPGQTKLVVIVEGKQAEIPVTVEEGKKEKGKGK